MRVDFELLALNAAVEAPARANMGAASRWFRTHRGRLVAEDERGPRRRYGVRRGIVESRRTCGRRITALP